jgi:glycosyltransferase involved in cell wall biosynthesis
MGISSGAEGTHSVETSTEIPFRRWLLITQYYAPEAGAPQVRLRALVRELTQRGCEVDVLTAMPNYPTGKIFPSYRGKLSCTETIDGCKVRRLWLFADAGRNPVSRLLCYLSFSIGAALRAPWMGKYDMVFVEAQPITLAFAGLLLKLTRRIPFIYNTPDLQVEIAEEQQWMGSRALLKAAAAVETFLMQRSFCVATVTESFVDHFSRTRAIARRRISFLPNGADVEALRPAAPDVEYARQLGVEGKRVITYCGTLAHYHGLDVLIDAAAKTRHRDDIVFLIGGDGPVRAMLQERSRSLGLKNVLFVACPFHEVRRLMSITTASVATIANIPAASKMRLSKVIPSLACGIPVIYVGRGEFAGILRQQGCGWLVEPSSADQLAGTIERIADDPEAAVRMGKIGREYVEQHLAWPQIVERWLTDLRCVKTGEDLWDRRVSEQQPGGESARLTVSTHR